MNGFSVIFNCNDKIFYDKHEAVCELLGVKNKPRKATIKLNDDIVLPDNNLKGVYLWFPIIEECKRKGWKNKLSEDKNTIYVKADNKLKNKFENYMFITFGKFLINSSEKYRFLGIYRFVKVDGNYGIFIKRANSFVGTPIAFSNI